MKKILLAVACFLFLAGNSQAQVGNFNVGDVCPNFTVVDINGVSHTLYDITATGQYVMLDFFFTTCPPCQQTAPIWNQLHEKYGCNQGQLYCLSVDNGDTDAQVIAYSNSYGGSFSHAPHASGNEGGGNAVNATFGIVAYPTYTLIGPDNKFINTDIWPISNVGSFEAAFPSGSNIMPMACSAVAVDDRLESASIAIYPNPASEYSRMDLSFENYGEVEIQLFDLLGKQVAQRKIGQVGAGAQSIELDLSSIQNGMYFVRVQQDGQLVASSKLEVLK